jgi:hypothetical protein
MAGISADDVTGFNEPLRCIAERFYFGVTQRYSITLEKQNPPAMKKIDILNYITDFRKAPKARKSYEQITNHLNVKEASHLDTLLAELKQLGTVREMDVDGIRYFQVVTK